MDSPPPRPAITLLKHTLVLVLYGTLFGAAIGHGLGLRRWAWEMTGPIHFLSDITRGYGWGLAASEPDGLLNAYDKMAGEQPRWQKFLDYAPLRLAVMRWWAVHNRATQTPFEDWRPDYDFNAPVLKFNAGMELVGVVAVFLIVRRVRIDARRAAPALSWPREWGRRLLRRPVPRTTALPPHRPFTGWPAATIAALLLWYNPVMILSAHAWPTWDTWVIPMYLLAVLAALYDAWLWVGVAMALGAMFKGQTLVGLPVFAAWTLLNGRWTAALRLACGLAIGLAAVAAPWLLTRVPAEAIAAFNTAYPDGPPSFDTPLGAARTWNPPAVAWVAGVTAAAAALPFVARRRGRWVAVAWAAAVAAVVWPAVPHFDLVTAGLLLAGGGALAAAAWGVRRVGGWITLACTAAAGAMLACIALFGASTAWWTCGVAYGTNHWQRMVMGFTDNLAGILAQRFDHDDIHEIVFTLPAWAGGGDVAMQQFLRGLFVIALVPCLWAVARHARRHDPRLLVAVVAPWMMFFTFPAQIHDRYLIFAAATASLLVVQSLGMTLIGVVLTAIAFKETLHIMLEAAGGSRRQAFGGVLHAWLPSVFGVDAGQTLYRGLEHTWPDVAWAVLLIAPIFIYQCVRSTPRALLKPAEKLGRQTNAGAV